MQIAYMFIDWGAGWTPLNDHTRDVAALDSLSIRWGTDDITEQTEPSVMNFTLHDRTGWLTGRALTLAGAQIVLQVSGQPTWGMLRTDQGTWAQQTGTLGRLHQTYTPPVPDSPQSTAVTLFHGIVSTGGEATPHRAGGWKLALSASSRMILWKRMQSDGPTSSDARYTGLHWVGTGGERLAELNKRAQTASAPTADPAGLTPVAAPAPYADDNPSQLDLLHRLFAHLSDWPIWYEYPDRDTSRISCMTFGSPVIVGITDTGRLTVASDTGETFDGLDAADIITDDGNTLSIPEPYTQITLHGKRAKANNGALQFDPADTTLSDRNLLPANLTATQKSITIDTDAVTSDESGGVWSRGGGAIWQPDDTDRTQIATLLETIDRRLRPETVIFDGRKLDPAVHPRLYITASSGPLVIQGMLSSNLAGDDGKPATGGPWASIGGTLTYQWSNNQPLLHNEVTLWPLPTVAATATTWASMGAWPATWRQCALTLAELSLITRYQQPTTITEEP